MTAPYYTDDHVTLYHGDCRHITEWTTADALLTDPPYGINYRTNHPRADETELRRSIKGDADTQTRDEALTLWGDGPAIIFGSWRRPRPAGTHTLLIWDTMGALGSGNLSIPWKPAHQEMYVLGHGWRGHRGTDVYRYPPVQSTARLGRLHPHEKPVPLLSDLLTKARPGWTIADPFAGSGSVLVAARLAGLPAIGVELDEADCEVIAQRLTQGDDHVKQRRIDDVLDFAAMTE